MPVARTSRRASPARGPSTSTDSIASGLPAWWATAARAFMPSSEEDAEILGEDHVLVEEDLSTTDPQSRNRPAQHVVAPHCEDVEIGLEAIPIEDEVRRHVVLLAGRARTHDDVRD